MAAAHGDPSRSRSFRVEIGSVSRRRAPPEVEPAGNSPLHLRTFSLGSSFEYMVEEEVEAVVGRIRRQTEEEEKQDATNEAAALGEEAAGGGGRGWLREHVDRLASSASSSFSSILFSGRWRHRYDGRCSCDLEGSARREAEGGSYGIYR